ncbi:LysR family transcriptional regulator [Microvirga zambiensis]|uniref:LysR family transcriptional regulator n=1 Tax=Microvirga zambiensis TaxID=1402137 RepID=UPI00191E2D4D|nr:LysR family transcriptional regulator [Microvirga zambiensis]
MDLRSIQYFVKVAELGSYTRAAKQANIAQSALSRHILRLEAELGMELFHRTSRGVRLTDAGSRLLERAQRLISDFEETRDQMRALAGTPMGSVSLGVATTLCPIIIPPVVDRLRKEAPKIKLRVVGSVTSQLEESLLQGGLDAAIFSLITPPSVIACQVLCEEQLVLVSPPNSELPLQISGRHLCSIPLTMTDALRRIVEPSLAAAGHTLNVGMALNSSETIRLLVHQGNASTILPCSLVREEHQRGLNTISNVVDPVLERRIAFGSIIGRKPSIAEAEVKRIVQEVVASLKGEGVFRFSGAQLFSRQCDPLAKTLN